MAQKGDAVLGRRLLLVDPYPRNNPYHLTASERRAVWFPKLSLPVIAAYTPPGWDVALMDEAVQEIDFDHPCDLVGLSIMTCYAPRAYEIAAEFRRRGKTVVLGGVHPTYCPDEALRYCDAIVCGEAEDLWPQLVADFEAGCMKRVYRMEHFPRLDNYISPRVDLLSPDAYMTRQCTFTTRGCHFECEFCSVSPFNGKTTRRRPVQEVIKELAEVKKWISAELVQRIRRGSLREAFMTGLKIRLGIEDGSIVASPVLRRHRVRRGGRSLAAARGGLRGRLHEASIQDGTFPPSGQLHQPAGGPSEPGCLYDEAMHLHHAGLPL